MDEYRAPCRLKEVMKLHEISNEGLQNELHISENTLKAYLNGGRDVPAKNAITLADKYNFTLDWFFYRMDTPNFTEGDIMANILVALSKIFRIRTRPLAETEEERKTTRYHEDILLIHPKFRDFLSEIRELEYMRHDTNCVAEKYQELLQSIHEKYKGYFKELFNMDESDPEKWVQIDAVVDDKDFLNFL